MTLIFWAALVLGPGLFFAYSLTISLVVLSIKTASTINYYFNQLMDWWAA